MKTLVTYFSQTGNTKKIAEAIYEEIDGEKDLKEMDDVATLDGYNIAFVGSPVHAFGPSQKLKEFLEEKAKDKRIALFITHGAPEEEAESLGYIANCSDVAVGADLVDLFHCWGEVDQSVIDHLLKSDDEKLKEFGRRGPETKGQPDEERVAKARAFARKVMEA